MIALAKRILFPLLPKKVLKKMRGRHYLNKFSELTGEDEPEMLVIKTLISENDVVLDIGANFGAYTKFFTDAVGAGGMVYSFEPIPEVNGYLRANLLSCDIKNVKVQDFALSDTSGKASFSIPKFDHSGENFYEGHLTDGEGDIIVEVKRLDDLELQEKVSFVKCDVEGAELMVMKGAIEFTAKHRPIYMLEINSEPSSKEAQELIQFMMSLGYEIKFMSKGALVKDLPSIHGVNYFFFPN